MRFEWDEKKDAGNIQKHGISFRSAIRIFQDPYMVDWYDSDNSGYNKYGVWEDRFIALGYVEDVLVVVYTIRERGNEEIVHMISARPAEAVEIKDYIEHRNSMI